MDSTLQKNNQVNVIVNKIESIDGFYGLEKEWCELIRETGEFFCSYDWLLTCYKIFHKKDSLAIFTMRIDSQLSAIVPLVVRKKKKGLVRSLEYIGSFFHYEPCGILINSIGKVYLDKILYAILKMNLPIYLRRGQHEDVIRIFSLDGTQFHDTQAVSSPYVPVMGTFDDFASSLSSKRRYDLRRARRRAEQIGKVEFDIIKPNSSEVVELLEMCYRIEATGWKGQKGTAILNHYLPLREFFNSYGTKAAEKGIFRLGVMRIGGVPVAMLFGVEFYQCFWVLKTGYDETYRQCSPGILVIHECLRYAFDNSLSSFEFLGSDEAWLHVWSDKNKHDYTDISIVPHSLQGWLGRLLLGLS